MLQRESSRLGGSDWGWLLPAVLYDCVNIEAVQIVRRVCKDACMRRCCCSGCCRPWAGRLAGRPTCRPLCCTGRLRVKLCWQVQGTGNA